MIPYQKQPFHFKYQIFIWTKITPFGNLSLTFPNYSLMHPKNRSLQSIGIFVFIIIALYLGNTPF